ncbi:MAG: hypothetical protein ACYCYF_00905 [Anaerolineae bacterium]
MNPVPRTRSTTVLSLLALVAMLALAGCNAAGMPDDGPEPVLSEAASRNVVERVIAVGEDTAPGASFTITATQDEISSFLAIGAEVLAHYQDAYASGVTPAPRQIPGIDARVTDAQWQQAMDELNRTTSGPAAVLTELRSRVQNPRVYLKADGVLVLRGTASAAGASLPLRVVLVPEASVDGYAVRIREAQLGTVSAPTWVTDLIERGVADGMDLANKSAVITDIRITQGQITVTGTAND